MRARSAAVASSPARGAGASVAEAPVAAEVRQLLLQLVLVELGADVVGEDFLVRGGGEEEGEDGKKWKKLRENI